MAELEKSGSSRAGPASTITSALLQRCVSWSTAFLFSKLNPGEFVDGFDCLAIGCLDAEADKRTAAAGQQRSPNSHCVAVGIDCPSPPIAVLERSDSLPTFRLRPPNSLDDMSAPRRNLAPLLLTLVRLFWILFLALVVPMARQSDHHPSETVLHWCREGSALAISSTGHSTYSSAARPPYSSHSSDRLRC